MKVWRSECKRFEGFLEEQKRLQREWSEMCGRGGTSDWGGGGTRESGRIWEGVV